ncbi:sigma-70 family RNA polymerase sigma factor [Caldibacillus lycopersici]|uniref:Sigma-70 family RNA polymerase sigma factor n=1 Tax=Perspicuibacillus lycopersici TaxID=1325689 RepID=A0AAE3IT92_9BACI|nr:sigma-70 family RNA polymerase sigma factor [Perspicuibacillus lycopersici]MCU9613039.1 sigma-70 family RNA polymerase sigma factor [Perspicuibacillus lycopersici]
MKDFTEVVKEMTPIIHSIIRKLNIYKNEEEYFQIGLIGLWEAYQSFNPEKGSFLTYAYYSIRGRILTELIRDMIKDKNEMYVEDQQWERIEDKRTGLRDEQRLQLNEMIAMLPARQRQIMELHYVQGKKLTEIAFEQGVSYSTVKLWKRDLLANLEKQLFD